MSVQPVIVKSQCLSLREFCSSTNMKSMLRSFVYEYETPKIVTIHSISIALMCRIIQLLILIYGVVYLMIIKKGYQETNTSIISSITLKVKGIGYNETGPSQTLVIDGADYIVPPQENNALFLMTNFIRTDQEHKRCAEAPDIKGSACTSSKQCELNKDSQKGNGKWTGECVLPNNSSTDSSKSLIGQCELEGWCPVENDRDIPRPIRDALNFTIFVKNFIEFPRFRVIRKNIQHEANYLKQCNYDPGPNKYCPIFRVGTLLDIVEPDPDEQLLMLKLGGVIRVKIDWQCNLDKSLDECKPAYSFKRLDESSKKELFSHGFNFRFASHWKHQNRSFRTLTKAYGLRFIISVSGHAGQFHVITLSLSIGSLIGILGLATFICDIVALYVHNSSDVYRQQKFQDVDLNLLRLETLNNLADGMMSDSTKRKHEGNHEQVTLTDHVIENHDATSVNNSPHKENFRRYKQNHHVYDNLTTSSPPPPPQISPSHTSNNYHQKETTIPDSTADSPTSIKQRRSTTARPSQLPTSSSLINDSIDNNDKINIVYVDEDSPDIHETNKSKPPTINVNEHKTRPTPKIETFL